MKNTFMLTANSYGTNTENYINAMGHFPGKKVKTTVLAKKPFFSPQTNLGTYVNLYSFERSMKWPFSSIFTSE